MSYGGLYIWFDEFLRCGKVGLDKWRFKGMWMVVGDVEARGM